MENYYNFGDILRSLRDHRGLSQVTNWVRLKFAAMNLKKYAVHRWKKLYTFLHFMAFEAVFA